MSADAVVEQTTAETEQGTADTQLAMAQDLMRESQVASDAAGRLQQERDIADAQEAAKAAAAAALDHFNSADQKATDARAKAVEARDAADRAVRARTDSGEADTQATAAETAATEAEMARADGVDGCGRRGCRIHECDGCDHLRRRPDVSGGRGRREGHRGRAGDGRGHELHDRHGGGSRRGDGRRHARPRLVHVGECVRRQRRRRRGRRGGKCRGGYRCSGSNGQMGGSSRRSHRYCCVGCRQAASNGDEDEDAVAGLLKITFNSDGYWWRLMIRSQSDTVGDDDMTPPSNPMPSRPTSVAISRTCSTFRMEGARVLVFTDKEQDTPKVVAVTAVTLVNAMQSRWLNKLRLWVSPVMVGQASRVPSTMIYGPILPRLRERSSVLVAPAHWLYGQRGRCHGHDRDRLHVFRKQGRRYGCAAAAKADYLLFGVWLDEVALRAQLMRAPIPSGPSQRVDSRSPRATCKLSKVQRRIAVPQSGPIIRRGAGCRFSMATPI